MQCVNTIDQLLIDPGGVDLGVHDGNTFQRSRGLNALTPHDERDSITTEAIVAASLPQHRIHSRSYWGLSECL